MILTMGYEDKVKHFIKLSNQAQWPDWAIFRYFWRLIMIFWKDEVAQRNGDILGYFLLKQIYYIFT